MLVGDGRVELVTPTGDDTPVGALPVATRSGHASRRALHGRPAYDPRRARVPGSAAHRPRSAPGSVRARGRVRPSRFRPRRPHGGGCEWLTTSFASRSGSQAGKSSAGSSPPDSADALDRNLGAGASATLTLDAQEGTVTARPRPRALREAVRARVAGRLRRLAAHGTQGRHRRPSQLREDDALQRAHSGRRSGHGVRGRHAEAEPRHGGDSRRPPRPPRGGRRLEEGHAGRDQGRRRSRTRGDSRRAPPGRMRCSPSSTASRTARIPPPTSRRCGWS